MIGDHCCTFIPDIAGNITDTITQLNSLLTGLKSQDVPDEVSGWNWWSWLIGGWWSAWLARFIAPMAVFFFAFLFCVCCVIPLIKKMFSSLFLSHIVQYQALQHTDSPCFNIPTYGFDNDDSDNAPFCLFCFT